MSGVLNSILFNNPIHHTMMTGPHLAALRSFMLLNPAYNAMPSSMYSRAILESAPMSETVKFLTTQIHLLRSLAASSENFALKEALQRAAGMAASMTAIIAGEPFIAEAASNAASSAAVTGAAAAATAATAAAAASAAASTASEAAANTAANTAVLAATAMTVPAFKIPPNLASATWMQFISLLKNIVTVARETLPWTGGIVVASAAAAVAFHMVTVTVPVWLKQEERRRAQRMAEASQRLLDSKSASSAGVDGSTQNRILLMNPEAMSVDALVAEVTSLRAEVEKYRAAAAAASASFPSKGPPELSSSSPASSDSTINSTHVSALEAANASLRETVARLTSELQDRVAREKELVEEIQTLTAVASQSESQVHMLRQEVDSLRKDKDLQEHRIGVLENNIDQLRNLFTSMVVRSRQPTPSLPEEVESSSPANPLLEDMLSPITPFLDLSNSSLMDKSMIASFVGSNDGGAGRDDINMQALQTINIQEEEEASSVVVSTLESKAAAAVDSVETASEAGGATQSEVSESDDWDKVDVDKLETQA